MTVFIYYDSREKPFLFEIVNNTRNGIDVDKYVVYPPFSTVITDLSYRFYYISRDTHAIGDKGNLSLERLVRLIFTGLGLVIIVSF
jgi:hypothetical protein